ncbi:MAG: histidinol-phosphate transaminase [Coxiellaceae bacterium]|nr:histidinol-phosphate transaminase [Coxiellaceae bacterium]
MAFCLDDWLDPNKLQQTSLQLNYREYPDDFIQLALMENPFSWSEDLRAQWLKVLESVALNRYPSISQQLLKQKLCHFFNIPDDYFVLLDNGSNALIALLLRVFSGEGRNILVPSPSYFVYDRLARQMGYQVSMVDLKANRELDLNKMLNNIKLNKPVLTFIAYPNNPTGNCFNEKDIEAIITASCGLVVIDEAYYPYSQKTFLEKIQRYDNVLLMRSFSKMGLAGIRLGYLVGPKTIIDTISKLQLAFSINSLTLATADFMLNHYDLLLEQTQTVIQERDRLKSALENNFSVLPSDANYLVIRSNDLSPEQLHQHCLAQKILISNISHVHPLLKGCCRVSIGTPAESQLLLNTLSMPGMPLCLVC